MKKLASLRLNCSTIFFNTLGNNLYVEEFGNIAMKTSSRKSEIRHGITAQKLASIEAIPDVLRNGKVVFFASKDNGAVKRIVVAAPIKIGTKEYIMGVMLQRDSNNQRLYLHNVLSIEKETVSNSSVSRLLTSPAGTENNLSMSIILKKVLDIKTSGKKVIRIFETHCR